MRLRAENSHIGRIPLAKLHHRPIASEMKAKYSAKRPSSVLLPFVVASLPPLTYRTAAFAYAYDDSRPTCPARPETTNVYGVEHHQIEERMVKREKQTLYQGSCDRTLMKGHSRGGFRCRLPAVLRRPTAERLVVEPALLGRTAAPIKDQESLDSLAQWPPSASCGGAVLDRGRCP